MIWPVYRYGDRFPATTPNLFVAGTHDGVDIGWPWRPGDAEGPPDTDDHRHWTILGDAPAIAVEAGEVLYAEQRRRGFAVRIRGPLYDRCYFHGRAGTGLVRKGEHVREGQELYVIGSDPLDRGRWRHLHYETRRPAKPVEREGVDGWARDQARGCVPIDPWPELRQAQMLDAPRA